MLHLHFRPRLPSLRLRLASLASRPLSSWAENASNPKHKVQYYLSSSNNPYLNLSIEQFLLERTPSDSCILFLYINRPCIVIGRNQNPWLEVNLNILKAAAQAHGERPQTEPHGLGNVDLVRRRSGGGTVFHDEGNVNWSIICPSAIFTRDKHAEMIVRSLRKHGVERARVNERHDIVLDQGDERNDGVDAADLHRTPYTIDAADGNVAGPRAVKVSGSAYKLTKGRALHHGTCLLSTPNLQVIPHYLHSPARGYIKAKGVESVSSPVANIGLDRQLFCDGVKQGFMEMYASQQGSDVEVRIGERALDEPGVKRLYDEMQTSEWTYGQTPQFTFFTQPMAGSTRKLVQAAADWPGSSDLTLDFKHGQLIAVSRTSGTQEEHEDIVSTLKQGVRGRRLYDHDWQWEDVAKLVNDAKGETVASQTDWLNSMLPPSTES